MCIRIWTFYCLNFSVSKISKEHKCVILVYSPNVSALLTIRGCLIFRDKCGFFRFCLLSKTSYFYLSCRMVGASTPLIKEFIYQCKRFSKHRPSGPMLSISPNVRLSVRPSVCPSVSSLFRYRLNIFRSRMSNIFRDSESLGKSNGKNWSNI